MAEPVPSQVAMLFKLHSKHNNVALSTPVTTSDHYVTWLRGQQRQVDRFSSKSQDLVHVEQALLTLGKGR